MLSFIKETVTCWEKLEKETRPIFIYGMGDGAQKIMNVFSARGIKVSGIFASDDFVRGHYFEGFKVKRLSEVEEEYEDFVVILAFAAGYRELVDKIHDIASKHTLYVPDVPVVGSGLFTYDYCVEHESELQAVYDMLADDFSRKVYANIINFKISGNIKYLDEVTTPKVDIYKEIIRPNLNEVYVDLGAYNGDTIEEFLTVTRGKYISIYAMEPDRKNFKKLCRNTENLLHVYAYNSVAWSCETQIPFSTKAGRQSSVVTTGQLAEARSVDGMLDGEQATIIKMDVEGCEREAIWGSAHTIKKYSPKLMVSLYHRNEDIFELPLLIKKLNPDYKCYIRHQLYIPAWETNLYAVR